MTTQQLLYAFLLLDLIRRAHVDLGQDAAPPA